MAAWDEGGERMIRSVITTAVIAALGISAAQAQNESYQSEKAARDCIHNRMAELVAQDNRNVTADAALTACANDLRGEIKAKKKSECEATDYVGWLIADENSKLNNIRGRPYKPDKAFIVKCQKPGK
jgi:enhancing lycopene biosynthesis protein 2